MSEVVSVDLIESWLSGSANQVGLRFPGPLEHRFEADTRAERSHMMMIFGALGFVFGSALYPALCDGMPDVAQLTRHVYLDVAMPLGFATAALMGLNPPPRVREGLMLLSILVCIGTTMWLYAVSRSPFSPALVAGVMVMMVYSAVGVQLRFKFAVVALLVILLTFDVALSYRPDITDAARPNLMLLVVCTAAYLILANWRLEREHRRAYLLTLREALQKQALSQRTMELDELTRRDALTGLANRRAYDAWLAAVWAQAASARGRLGLIVIDVDRFKAFNDFAGHSAGDGCLQKIAVCLRDQLRGTTDLVARLGGEEFAVLLPSLPENVCADVAERLRLAVQQLELPHPGIGAPGLVTVSAGVASQVVLPDAQPRSLFDAADAALYQAKLLGRNQVCVATIGAPSEISRAVAE